MSKHDNTGVSGRFETSRMRIMQQASFSQTSYCCWRLPTDEGSSTAAGSIEAEHKRKNYDYDDDDDASVDDVKVLFLPGSCVSKHHDDG